MSGSRAAGAVIPCRAVSEPARTPYQPYGTAVYHRRIRVEVWEDGARTDLVDDFHHFRARIRHDGRALTEVEGEAVRYPWSTCAGATEPLLRLVGMPLGGSSRAAARHTASNAQCTHLFDAASLAIARAARGAGGVEYLIRVPDRAGRRASVSLDRDGEPLLRWELVDMAIRSPAPYAGRALRGGGLADWAERELDPETAEAVLALQRACVISGGRIMDLERIDRADRVQPNPMGACHTYTPGIVERGRRMVGSIRNSTGDGRHD